MWCLAAMGERQQAMRLFESFRASLGAEFGLAPLEETAAFYERLRSGASLDGQRTFRLIDVTEAEVPGNASG
jgi:DNA-binding SARP family transcriptional activator